MSLKDEALETLTTFTDTTGKIHGSNHSFLPSANDPYANSYILQSMSYVLLGYAVCNGNEGLQDFANGFLVSSYIIYHTHRWLSTVASNKRKTAHQHGLPII